MLVLSSPRILTWAVGDGVDDRDPVTILRARQGRWIMDGPLRIPNYILFVASYGDDAAAAAEDFEAIKDLGDSAVVAAVVLDRGADGKVDVTEHGAGPVGVGTAVGAVGGLVIALFAPPLLLAASVVGGGIGAGVGKIMKHHEEKQIGVVAEDWLPVNSSAVVAVVDDLYLDRVEAAVSKAVKRTQKVIDKGDYTKVVNALQEGGDDIAKALDS
jgi:hypothetical protein